MQRQSLTILSVSWSQLRQHAVALMSLQLLLQPTITRQDCQCRTIQKNPGLCQIFVNSCFLQYLCMASMLQLKFGKNVCHQGNYTEVEHVAISFHAIKSLLWYYLWSTLFTSLCGGSRCYWRSPPFQCWIQTAVTYARESQDTYTLH